MTEVFDSAERAPGDLNGLCPLLSGSIAAGWGFGDDEATSANLGAGRDWTFLVIFKGFLPPRPSVAFLMEGDTAGLNADAGVYHGYAYVAA